MKNQFPPVDEQLERIKDSVAPTEILSVENLHEKLERSRNENKPLRIKQGFDASAPDLHIGHAVSIWKLRTFQELGHQVIFLIGDFTGMVGDPSGKSKTRPRLTREQVEVNAETYRQQVFHILDPELTEIRFNSEWHAKRDIYKFLELTSHYTVRRMLERDDYWKRFQAEQPISMLEFLYPLIQAYDSVALEADVELGGTDQKFNLVLTRHIQRAYGKEPQVVFLMPLLRGTDGNDKMSKSLDNAIGIIDPPEQMYGKIMSISDEMLPEYYRMASGLDETEMNRAIGIAEIEQALFSADPFKQKHDLARLITARYHDDESAANAGVQFLARFKEKSLPTPAELIESGSIVKVDSNVEWLPKIMVASGAVKSNGEAQRLIKQGAVSIDGEKLEKGADLDIKITALFILKVGKRRFYLVYRDNNSLMINYGITPKHWQIPNYIIRFKLKFGELDQSEICIVLKYIKKWHKELYHLHAVQVMPNRVHVILEPKIGYSLKRIKSAIKRCTARQINISRRKYGKLWGKSDEDFINNIKPNSLKSITETMYNYPVENNLVKHPEDYKGWYFQE